MSQYFDLTLDTLAPQSNSVSFGSAIYNAAATDVTASSSGAAFMKVWVNASANGATTDTEYPSAWIPYSASAQTKSFTAQGNQYAHAQFMDEVGNISSIVDSSAVIYDSVAPTVDAISIEDGAGYTKVTSVSTRVTFSDATSGVVTVTLSGDIAAAEATDYTVSAAEQTAGYKDITVTLQGADGTKTVTATVTDAAGNTSASASDTIVLDTTAAEFTPVLRNADNTANLPGYVNDDDYSVNINTEATDITHYKVWEGSTEPDEWTAISSATQITGGYNIPNLTLSASDGTKEIHTKVQDIAGNVTTGTVLSVVYDTTAPVVTLSSDVTVISAETGFDTATFTLGATDANAAAGLAYVLKCDGTQIDTGSLTISGTSGSATVALTEAEIVAISSGEGTKVFTLEVTDAAENTGISSAVNVTVDLTAPTGSVTASTYYNTSTVTVTISASDTGGAGMDEMKVYLDSETASWEPYAAGTYTFTSVDEGAHTAHVQFRDAVDNTSSVYDSSQLIVDTTAPTGTISGPTYTNTASITLTITSSDGDSTIARSGVEKMKVWETGTTEPDTWENYAASKSLTLTAVDGQYTVSMKLKDAAGNETTTAIVSNTINLDQDEPQGTIALYDSTDSAAIAARVNVTGFYAHIAPTDETAPVPVQYQIYGDFAEAMGTDAWLDYAPDTGKQYKSIAGTLNTPDGTKTIYVKFKDAAGNVSSAASASVVLDQTPPVIDVNAPDYNIVSKQHTLRLNSSAEEITGKYNDTCTFTWSCAENLVVFKVCVNEAGQEAATATAIGTTGGSQNMTGSNVAANTTITSIIMGADFAATDAVNETDGAYEIIVYGQDEAGSWSLIHALNA